MKSISACVLGRSFLALVLLSILTLNTFGVPTNAYYITTIAGSGTSGYVDDNGKAARFSSPRGIAVDNAGNLYVADTENSVIRRIAPSGNVNTLAGIHTARGGSNDGNPSQARFNRPTGIAVDQDGYLYVADTDNAVIRKITPDGYVTTLAGSSRNHGTADGTGTNASFLNPVAVALDGFGNLYVSEGHQVNTIRRVSPYGEVVTVAGVFGGSGSFDGPANKARFMTPSGISVAPGGTVLIAESEGRAIRTFWPSENTVHTFYKDPTMYIYPTGIVADGVFGCFFVDFANNLILYRGTNGPYPNAIAGGLLSNSSIDGYGPQANFYAPYAICRDNSDFIYVTDLGSSTIRLGSPVPLGIAAQPLGATVVAGKKAVLGIRAGGALPITYQWHANGTNIVGETKPYLAFSSVSATNVGDYSVTVSNRFGVVESSIATLTVVIAPTITQQPQNQSVVVGSNAVFSVVATNNAPITYQWQFKGVDIPGATSPTYIITNVTTANAGNYAVVVGDNDASILSSVVSLTVLAPPAISSQPQSQTVVAGNWFSMSVTCSGTTPLSYQWQHNGTNLQSETSDTLDFQVTPSDAGSYTLIVTNAYGAATSQVAILTIKIPPSVAISPNEQEVIAGSDVTFSAVAAGDEPLYYQWIANNTNILGATSSTLVLHNISAYDGGYYFVLVSNAWGTAASGLGLLLVHNPPSITQAPVDCEVGGGQGTRLTVTADGDGPLSYQWQQNGVPIANATDSDYWISAATARDAGQYTVVITNQYGAITSSIATVTVLLPPSINTQPTNQVVILGNEANFKVDVTGTSPFNYEWRFNGVPVSGAIDDSMFTIPHVTTANTGKYKVVISNPYGTITSAVATLSVLIPPSFSLQPTNQSIGLGTNTSVVAKCNGDQPLHWQWFLNGINIVGATNEYVAINGASMSDAGKYIALVTNAWGAVTSKVAIITVLEPASVVTDPQPQTVLAGGVATFTVTAKGSAPISYQWFFGATAISGANASTYSLTNISTANMGHYRVLVTNLVGGGFSKSALLTVQVPPSISVPPQRQNLGAGSNVTFSVVAQGDEPLFYRWRCNGHELPGQTSPSLTISGLAPSDSGQYCVVVTNACGSVTSILATLAVYVPPSIITQPKSTTNGVGSAVSFNVAANGSSPISYQWLLNGGAILDAKTATYTIPSVTVGHVGNYSVIVTNLAGCCTSACATLTVPEPPYIGSHPRSQMTWPGSNVTFSVNASGGTPLSYQWQFNGTNIAGCTSDTCIVTNASLSKVGYYRVIVTNISGSVTSRVAILSIAVAPSIVTQPQSRTNLPGTTADFLVVASGSSPLNYQWQFNGVSLPQGTYPGLSIPSVSSAQAGSYSVIVSNAYGAVTSAPARLLVQIPPSITEPPSSKTIGAGSNVTFTVIASGDSPLTYSWRFNGVDLGAASLTNLTRSGVSTTNAGAYSVVVANPSGIVTSTVAMLTVLIPPSITLQPRDSTNSLGSRAEFNVVVTGSTPLSYQWRWNGTNVGGAVATNYVIPSVAADHFGGYSVVISNTAGMTTSRIATLTVLSAPRITQQPASQSAAVGAKAVLGVTASGLSPMFYQWQKNGAKITANARVSGANSNLLTIAAITAADAGTYSVLVTNAMGRTVSSNAILTVYVPDSTKPTVTLTVPKANQSYVSNINTFLAAGTARDNGCVSNVYVKVNTNAWAQAFTTNRWTNWSFAMAFAPGTNVIGAYAVDSTGNCSATNTAVCIYVPVARLTVVTNSSGSVSPYTNGQWLTLGNSYTVMATPATGWIFSNWTGSVEGGVSTITFSMRSNTVLHPIFVPTPFAPLAGAYQGLFVDNSQSPSLGACGYFTLNLTAAGSFSSCLSLTNKTWPFSGQFGPCGTSTNTVTMGKSGCTVVLRLDINGTGELTGLVRAPAWTASVLARRAAYANTNRAPQAGRYTLIIPGTDSSSLQPGGDSYAALSVDTNGNVAIAGVLADGLASAFSQSSALSKHGQWPIYAALPSDAGVIFGWLTFTNEPDNDLNGILTWIRPASKSTRFYPSGFTTTNEAIGSRYVTNGSILKIATGSFEAAHGNLSAPLDCQFKLMTNNIITSTNKSLTITFSPASGAFSGSVSSANFPGGKLTFKGGVLQKQTNGFGFFTGTNQTGRVIIRPD